jgi:hypothetical protein
LAGSLEKLKSAARIGGPGAGGFRRRARQALSVPSYIEEPLLCRGLAEA